MPYNSLIQQTSGGQSATGTPTRPAVLTTASSVVLVANGARIGATVYNEGVATAYLKLGAIASLTSYTIQVASGGYYELPFGFTGEVDGITAAGTAQLQITELTA